MREQHSNSFNYLVSAQQICLKHPIVKDYIRTQDIPRMLYQPGLSVLSLLWASFIITISATPDTDQGSWPYALSIHMKETDRDRKTETESLVSPDVSFLNATTSA